MNVGLLTLEIYLPVSGSLKDKRRVLQSLQRRLRNQFNLAIAEVGQQELWQRATLAVVSEAERSIPGEVLGADREFMG